MLVWDGPGQNTILPLWLRQRAYLSPGREALITDQERLTFAELDQLARELAHSLSMRGVKQGDHVAALLSNRLHTVGIIHALSYLGAVLVPLNTRLTPAELAWQISDSDAAYVLFDTLFEQQAAMLKQQLTCPFINIDHLEDDFNGSANNKGGLMRKEIGLHEIQAIMYTSGTTGRPKGALISYGNHFWSAAGSALNLGLEQEDRWLCCVPLFHVSGLSILMRSVIYGHPVVLLPRFDPNAVNHSISKYRITHVSLVSSMLSAMLQADPHIRFPDHLRVILLGGGPAPKPLLQACLEKNLPVFQTYGLTETASQIVTLAPEDVRRKVGSAGKPLFPAQIRITNHGKPVETGVEGEITVTGPTVTCGYYNQPEATHHAIREGWFYTGDWGYLDEDGFLYVLDRRSDLIISGGENIYPAEIEATLLDHPDVIEAGVIGRPHEKWGAVPVGFVVKKEDAALTEEELLLFCRSRLAGYKVPTTIKFIKELPRNATGKLLRRELRSLLDH